MSVSDRMRRTGCWWSGRELELVAGAEEDAFTGGAAGIPCGGACRGSPGEREREKDREGPHTCEVLRIAVWSVDLKVSSGILRPPPGVILIMRFQCLQKSLD